MAPRERAPSADVPPPDEPPPDELAAAIHETTNALTVILGWIERAREACRELPEAVDALGRAARYARAARDGMRRSIGAEVPEQPPERAVELASRAVDDLAVEARRSAVQLETAVVPPWGDRTVEHPDVVWQVLTNLLLNAIAASPRDTRVLLEVEGAGAKLRFRVSDEGPGVAPSQRESLFDAGVSRRPGGAGIGLRHARAVVEEHGGALALLDDGPLAGACFELLWPAGAAATESQAPPSSRPPARGGLEGARVLLLEDDPAVVELLELSLGTRGAAITSVTTAPALGDALDNGRYDVLLVDLSPLGDGLDDAVAHARRNNPDIRVVVISGSVAAEPRPDMLWVRKPFEPRELVNAIVRERRRQPR